MPDTDTSDHFALFTEIGIIEQLVRALLEARMPDGLIAPHFGVVNHLTRLGDGRTPVELANAFQVAKTTMTHTLAGLEKRNLIEARPNPKDGRSKCIYLTDAGRAFHADTIAALAPEFARFSEAIPTERIRDALPLLSEVRAYLDENRP